MASIANLRSVCVLVDGQQKQLLKVGEYKGASTSQDLAIFPNTAIHFQAAGTPRDGSVNFHHVHTSVHKTHPGRGDNMIKQTIEKVDVGNRKKYGEYTYQFSKALCISPGRIAPIVVRRCGNLLLRAKYNTSMVGDRVVSLGSFRPEVECFYYGLFVSRLERGFLLPSGFPDIGLNILPFNLFNLIILSFSLEGASDRFVNASFPTVDPTKETDVVKLQASKNVTNGFDENECIAIFRQAVFSLYLQP